MRPLQLLRFVARAGVVVFALLGAASMILSDEPAVGFLFPTAAGDEPLSRGSELEDDAYESCVVSRGHDPNGVLVYHLDGRPTVVFTGVDVPADAHGACLAWIGGVDRGDSSWDRFSYQSDS